MRRRLPCLAASLAICLFLVGSTAGARGRSKVSDSPSMTPSSIREVMKRAADWQLEHPRGEPGDWTNAVFSLGLLAAWEATDEERYLDYPVRTAESLDWKPGPRYRHADDHAIVQTYLALNEIRAAPGRIEPFRVAIDKMMATPPDWPEHHQQIDYWWSDALFMSPPALVALAEASGDDRYLDFMDELWRQSYGILWDSQARLFYRDVRFRLRSPGEFWSRGNAWVLSGLALILEQMPEGRSARAFYLDVFRQMAAKVAGVQPADGLWKVSLLDTGKSARVEASGTALFCHALAWGVRTGVLERDRYLPVVEKGWEGLVRSVNDEGRLGMVQKPGASPQRVRGSHWATYGTGAFLLAGAELVKLSEQ